MKNHCKPKIIINKNGTATLSGLPSYYLYKILNQSSLFLYENKVEKQWKRCKEQCKEALKTGDRELAQMFVEEFAAQKLYHKNCMMLQESLKQAWEDAMRPRKKGIANKNEQIIRRIRDLRWRLAVGKMLAEDYEPEKVNDYTIQIDKLTKMLEKRGASTDFLSY